MNPDALHAELKELHRGRGVRRVGVPSWLGPELRSVLSLDAASPDADARAALIALIREHTEGFPRDLRYLFLVATGIAIDAPMLTDRLAVAEKALDRSQRVLRRRLREAEGLFVDALVAARERSAGRFDDPGWQWLDFDVTLELRQAAVLTLSRTVLALDDRQEGVHEAFVIPHLTDPTAEVTFEASEGLKSVHVARSAVSTWEVDLLLADVLMRGESIRTGLRLHIPEPRWLNPFLVLAPIRPARHVRVSVDFGDSGLAPEAWVLDGAFTSDIARRPAEFPSIDVAAHPVVSGTFDRPRPGLAYGVGWRWAEAGEGGDTP